MVHAGHDLSLAFSVRKRKLQSGHGCISLFFPCKFIGDPFVITVKQVLIPCLKFFGCIYLPESFYFFCVQIRIGHLHTDLFDRLFCELLYGPFSFCRLLCKLFGQLLCRLFLFLLLQIHPGIAHSLRAVDFYRFFKLADICIDSFDLINVNLILLRKDSICPSLCQNTHILIFCFIFQ